MSRGSASERAARRAKRLPRTAKRPHAGHGRRNMGGAPGYARRVARLKEREARAYSELASHDALAEVDA